MKPSVRLRRNLADAKVAGVAAGLSDFFGLDVTLIRALFVISALFTSGVIPAIYVLCWVLIPPDPSRAPGGPRRRGPQGPKGVAWTIFVIVLAIIAIASAKHVAPIAIAIGAAVITGLIYRKVRGGRSWRTRKEFEKARLAWQRRLDEQAAYPPQDLSTDPFQITSFYPQPPDDHPNTNDTTSGFQTQ